MITQSIPTSIFGRNVLTGLTFSALMLCCVGSASALEIVFDDMEHGDPFGNGWFAATGSGGVGGGGIAANGADVPPGGGAYSLESGWGSGGAAGFFGFFGRSNALDTGASDRFNFWINPDAGQDYRLEVNLQDDDDGDGVMSTTADDEFQFNCEVGAAGSCAVSGGGWQKVSIPFVDFFDDGSIFTGGNGVLDTISTGNGGNGELLFVVFSIVSNTGADVSFRTDNWTFDTIPSGTAPAPAGAREMCR
jgi:hypothetical protein